MRDIDIRRALIAQLAKEHADDPKTLIVEEIGAGRSRVDLAVVRDGLHGYEIKSRVDTLSRLPGQLRDYAAVFDEVTVVIGVKHLTGVLSEIPSWCGVILASYVDGSVCLEPFRAAQSNPHRDPYTLAQLLWRAEAVEVLERHNQVRGVKSKPREALWRRLSERLSLESLGEEVCRALQSRSPEWRVDSRQRGERSSVSRRPRRKRRSKRRVSPSRKAKVS